jgi:phosphoribosylamine--glycine ligase / phosphoribosylglycinamide formyltransferase / phosphoribosylformylglycinamidine cyclo-ligase
MGDMGMIDPDKPLTYREAGVDVDLGEAFVDRIKSMVSSTFIPGTLTELGSFSGAFSLKEYPFDHPVLVACTDGVGTKLKIAFEYNKHDTVGIDLVAMSVNDLAVSGAIPLVFLDYLATAKLNPDIHVKVVQGIVSGCRLAGCSLIGGETAEMPDMYAPGEYDLAGFAVGITDKNQLLDTESVQAGDVLIGIPSSGLHSNGFSLVRKLLADRSAFPLDKTYAGFSRALGDVLLEPTKIYTKEASILTACKGLKSLSHITGGGISGNLPRSLKKGLGAELDLSAWPKLPIFSFIQSIGKLPDTEMYRTFNMGLGLIAVVDSTSADSIRERLETAGHTSYIAGVVQSVPGIRYTGSGKHFPEPFSEKKPVKKCRLAIIGSGRGSNMESICRAIDERDLNAEVVCVISNNSKAFILERGRLRNIPTYHISSLTHPDPESRDTALLNVLRTCHVDFVCLAGYMKKISSRVINDFPGTILNIHPALLPAFGGPGMYGMKVHEAVIKSGAKVSGASVHIVNEEYDRGKIVGQKTVPVIVTDTPHTLAERVLRVEHEVYWETIADLISH